MSYLLFKFRCVVSGGSISRGAVASYFHYDIIRVAVTTRNLRASKSRYDVILIVMSFATVVATPSVTDERTDTLPRSM